MSDTHDLRTYSWFSCGGNTGIPDEQGARSLCWKLLLNYLPPKRSTWSQTLTQKRELYNQFIGKPILALLLLLF